MASLFSSRRKPKRIARDEPEEQADDGEEDTGPVVRRPNTNAPRTKSKLRVSFNPTEDDGSGTGRETGTGASTPSETALPRTTKPSRIDLAQDIISRRERDQESHDQSRTLYNKAYLDELRNSTPSTPRDISSPQATPSTDLIQPSSHLELDLESKFGKAVLSITSSHIPSAAEIKEKKDRRARAAKEQAANAYSGQTHGGGSAGDDFISLEDYDSDGEFRPRRMQVGPSISQAREKDTRLVHEDEDIAEGFDEYVEDPGRVTLSKRGLKEQSRQEREAIRNMIDQAEGSASEASDNNTDASDSDYERRKEYELAQTHHGMDGLRWHSSRTAQLSRPQQPRETTPIPKLSVGLARLKDMLSALEFEKARIVKRKADIERERADIKASQEHIQRSLEEAGQELERVKREHADQVNGTNGEVNGRGLDANAAGTERERGLESFGDNA
ncbi:hypothetical protein G647_06661 [Cladophialophora carrionii CBS 160.54]|uniref:Uncharacterized protein n=1 Tax=Cladophialophora carrionii CBS 160.54 TaxID=1279043 RepID=V9D6T4_9EURO|nr:uncharacterized protein G647_06661 [Cladophialophora carrionii CBS 160.54]ETI22585.1 hypothetical protein G647_06661 [Cladophialophora carrionii CBS 160.54]